MLHAISNQSSFKALLTGISAANSIMLPAGAYIQKILVQNTTANAVTGGLKFGATSGATDIVAALALAGNAVLAITDAAILKAWFATIQQIFIDAVVSWNNAVVNITIVYGIA